MIKLFIAFFNNTDTCLIVESENAENAMTLATSIVNSWGDDDFSDYAEEYEMEDDFIVSDIEYYNAKGEKCIFHR